MSIIDVPRHNYKTCVCPDCRDRYHLKTLADAIKTLDMTDKQILAACRPKLPYYTNMNKTSHRSCLWCHWTTERAHSQRYGEYIPEPLMQLEAHYIKTHAAEFIRTAKEE